MKFSDGIKMASKDLRRRLGRTFLTTLGIMIGTFLIVAMVSLGLGFRNYLVKDFKDTFGSKLVTAINIDGSKKEELDKANEEMDMEKFMELQNENFNKIDDETIKKFKSTDKVESVVAKIDGFANSIKVGDKEKDGYIPITGYSREGDLVHENDVKMKKNAKSDDSLNYVKYGESLSKDKKGEALIDELYAKDVFDVDSPETLIGKEVTVIVSKAKEMNIKPVSKTFKIVGIINEEFSEYGVITYADEASELISASEGTTDYLGAKGYYEVNINADSADDLDAVSDEITNIGYYNQTIKAVMEEINDTLDQVNIILGALGVIILIVAAIGIVNTMTMAVHERTKSIGVMKSQGATSGDIQLIFMTQSGLIGLIGGVVGALLGTGVAKLGEVIINGIMSSQAGNISVSMNTPSLLIILTIVGAVGIAVLSGLYPSMKASKMDPVEALR